MLYILVHRTYFGASIRSFNKLSVQRGSKINCGHLLPVVDMENIASGVLIVLVSLLVIMHSY